MKDPQHEYVYRIRNKETGEFKNYRVWLTEAYARNGNRRYYEIVRFKVDLDSMEVVDENEYYGTP